VTYGGAGAACATPADHHTAHSQAQHSPLQSRRVRTATLTSKPVGLRSASYCTVCKVRWCAQHLQHIIYCCMQHNLEQHTQGLLPAGQVRLLQQPTCTALPRTTSTANANNRHRSCSHTVHSPHAHGLLCTTHMAMTAERIVHVPAAICARVLNTAPPHHQTAAAKRAPLCMHALLLVTVTPCLLCGPSPSTSTSHSLHPMNGPS
jgi:hypothetical protein